MVRAWLCALQPHFSSVSTRSSRCARHATEKFDAAADRHGSRSCRRRGASSRMRAATSGDTSPSDVTSSASSVMQEPRNANANAATPAVLRWRPDTRTLPQSRKSKRQPNQPRCLSFPQGDRYSARRLILSRPRGSGIHRRKFAESRRPQAQWVARTRTRVRQNSDS